MEVVWTHYLKHRATLRGFDLNRIEQIVKSSNERYIDTATDRRIAVGRCWKMLVLIAFEASGEKATPVTVHATTRRQIALRVKAARFVHE